MTHETRAVGSPIKFEEPTLNFNATNMVIRALKIWIADTNDYLNDAIPIRGEEEEADTLNDLGYAQAMLADFERRVADVGQ